MVKDVFENQKRILEGVQEKQRTEEEDFAIARTERWPWNRNKR